MNPFATEAGADFLVFALLASTGACLAAFGCTLFFRRASASSRGLFWLLAFAVIVACLLLALLALKVNLPFLPVAVSGTVWVEPLRNISEPQPQLSPAAEVAGSPATVTSAPPSQISPSRPWKVPGASIVWGAWTAVALGLNAVYLIGIIRVRRMRREARFVGTGRLYDRLAEAATMAGLASQPKLYVAAAVRIPIVTGLFRPVIIVPAESEEWTDQTLRQTFLHELAHVQRGDLRSLRFAQIVSSLVWFNPLVWLALQELRQEVEMAADDCVVETEAEPVTYAETLVSFVRGLHGVARPQFSALGIFRGRNIEKRLSRILDAQSNRRAPSGPVKGFLLVGACVAASMLLLIRPVAAKAEAAQSIEGVPLKALERIAEQPFNQALQIDYHFSNVNEPRNVDQTEVERKVLALRKQLEGVKAAGITQVLENYRKSLTGRSGSAFDALFVLGSDFYATRQPGYDGPYIWEIRIPPLSYHLLEQTNYYNIKGILTVASDPGRHTLNLHDIARDSIGRLGRLDQRTLAELSAGGVTVTKENEVITLKRGNLTVVLDSVVDAVRLRSITRTEAVNAQKQEVIYENYAEMAGLSVPTKVTDIFENYTGRTTRSYTIKNIRFSDDYEVPMVNGRTGLLSVTDFRFSPKVEYYTYDRLPGEGQIRNWIADPEALKIYNAEMREDKLSKFRK